MSTKLVGKAFALLEAMAGAGLAGRGLADLAADAGLPKPTAHRILKTLVGLGYAERAAGCYRVGPVLALLANSGAADRLTAAADGPLRTLHRATRETVNLGVLRAGRVVYLAVLESPQPLRRTVDVTMTDPFACTALGRAVVANLPADRRAYLLTHTPIEKRTPATVVDPEVLATILDGVKAQGYAVDVGETDIGVVCVGAPVFGPTGVAGAISVSAPTVRAGPDELPRLAELVRHAAGQVTDKLRTARGAE